MRSFLFITLFIALYSLKINAQDASDKSGQEPKATFELTVNGKKYKVAENEELKLDTVISKPVITVKMSERKTFNNNSISFEYPRNMSFEFEQDFGYKNWTLSGNSLVIILFELDTKTTVDILMDEMVKKFGPKNCTLRNFEKKLGNKMCKGKRLNVKLVGESLTIDCYEIELNDYKSRFIYFQDSNNENSLSKEFQEGLKLIDSTIKYY